MTFFFSEWVFHFIDSVLIILMIVGASCFEKREGEIQQKLSPIWRKTGIFFGVVAVLIKLFMLIQIETYYPNPDEAFLFPDGEVIFMEEMNVHKKMLKTTHKEIVRLLSYGYPFEEVVTYFLETKDSKKVKLQLKYFSHERDIDSIKRLHKLLLQKEQEMGGENSDFYQRNYNSFWFYETVLEEELESYLVSQFQMLVVADITDERVVFILSDLENYVKQQYGDHSFTVELLHMD